MNSPRLRFGSVNEVFVVSCGQCHKVQPLGSYTRTGAESEAERLPGWSRVLDKYLCQGCRQPVACQSTTPTRSNP